MPNLICVLEHGTPDHDNLRTPAARDLLPGELDFNPTTGAVMIADRGAKLGKESAADDQTGRAVFRIKNPAYNPAGSNAITQQIGAKVYASRTTPASAFDAATNPYSTIIYANDASSLFVGTVADRPVRVTEEFVYVRFDNKCPVAIGAAAT